MLLFINFYLFGPGTSSRSLTSSHLSQEDKILIFEDKCTKLIGIFHKDYQLEIFRDNRLEFLTCSKFSSSSDSIRLDSDTINKLVEKILLSTESDQICPWADATIESAQLDLMLFYKLITNVLCKLIKHKESIFNDEDNELFKESLFLQELPDLLSFFHKTRVPVIVVKDSVNLIFKEKKVSNLSFEELKASAKLGAYKNSENKRLPFLFFWNNYQSDMFSRRSTTVTSVIKSEASYSREIIKESPSSSVISFIKKCFCCCFFSSKKENPIIIISPTLELHQEPFSPISPCKTESSPEKSDVTSISNFLEDT